MCFSATASFTAATILAGFGIASLSFTRKKSWIPFAAIPLIFAIQQLQEGFLWLALTNPNNNFFIILKSLYLLPKIYVLERFAFLFLIFAYAVWPSWIPFSLYTIEPNSHRKYWLGWLMIVGAGISGYLLYLLLSYGALAQIINHSIAYSTPPTPRWGLPFYLLTTIGSFFVSSISYTKLFGTALFFSCIASYLLWNATFASVWCFFAALLSSIIVIMVRQGNK